MLPRIDPQHRAPPGRSPTERNGRPSKRRPDGSYSSETTALLAVSEDCPLIRRRGRRAAGKTLQNQQAGVFCHRPSHAPWWENAPMSWVMEREDRIDPDRIGACSIGDWRSVRDDVRTRSLERDPRDRPGKPPPRRRRAKRTRREGGNGGWGVRPSTVSGVPDPLIRSLLLNQNPDTRCPAKSSVVVGEPAPNGGWNGGWERRAHAGLVRQVLPDRSGRRSVWRRKGALPDRGRRRSALDAALSDRRPAP